jgi:carbon storage regulator
MLALTRKVGEAVHIGDDVTVYVVRVEGRCVRLGIDAPRDVEISRSEKPTSEPELCKEKRK